MHCQTCRESPKYLCPLTHIVRPRLNGRHPDTWMYTPGENKKGFKKTLTLSSQNQKRGLTRVSQREWEKSPEFFFFSFFPPFLLLQLSGSVILEQVAMVMVTAVTTGQVLKILRERNSVPSPVPRTRANLHCLFSLSVFLLLGSGSRHSHRRCMVEYRN